MSWRESFACALWMAACMGIGYWAGNGLRRRVAALVGFARLFSYLSDSLVPLSLSYPEACARFARQEQGMAAHFAALLAQSLAEPCDPVLVFEAQVQTVLQKEELTLSPEEEALFHEAALCLLAQSPGELQKHLVRCAADAERLAKVAAESCAAKARLCQTLGFMAGALALIWMI